MSTLEKSFRQALEAFMPAKPAKPTKKSKKRKKSKSTLIRYKGMLIEMTPLS